MVSGTSGTCELVLGLDTGELNLLSWSSPQDTVLIKFILSMTAKTFPWSCPIHPPNMVPLSARYFSMHV